MDNAINDALTLYKEYQKQTLANHFVEFIMSWDSETEAPNGCFQARERQMEVLSTAQYKLNTNPNLIAAVQTLYDNRASLDEILSHEIEIVKKNIDKIVKIPMEEFVELNTLLASSQNIWAKAKTENNYELFKPTLKRIIELLKLYISHLETPELKGYNILLDKFEPGFTMKDYDCFFDTLKKDLVPFVRKVASKKLEYNTSFTRQTYPRDDQKKFVTKLMDVLCFDLNHGLVKESEHPFTSGFGTSDVRFTVHYYENLLTPAIFSAIHEMGHATYEMQVNPELDLTLSGGGVSMAMHESQSRFYENILGRSPEFWKLLFPKLKEIFPKQLKSIKLSDFIKHINEVKCSLIRTEADALTYPLHIMVRYDLEKAIFNNEITVDELPAAWNKLMKQYLGVDVPSDKEGVLQDIHWAGASFGYFPTYALGSAFAAQIYHSMKKDINIKETLQSSSTKAINDWLKVKIHHYGSTKYPKEILKLATNETFNPSYYVKYLIKKYSKIYQIK